MGLRNIPVQQNMPEALMLGALDQKLVLFFERIYIMVQKSGPNFTVYF